MKCILVNLGGIVADRGIHLAMLIALRLTPKNSAARSHLTAAMYHYWIIRLGEYK